jgi:hypothetical protein
MSATMHECDVIQDQLTAAREAVSTCTGTRLEMLRLFHQGVNWGRAHPIPPNPLCLVPRTMGGFKGAFYVSKHRSPTEQEIFDAGVRAGLQLAKEGFNDRAEQQAVAAPNRDGEALSEAQRDGGVPG